MFRLLMCTVISVASMSADATTPCASAFLSTPCPTLTTTPCVPVIVASTVSTTPLPCPSTGTTTPCGQWPVTATPLPCPSTVTTTPCVARTVATTPLPCPSTGTTTPCVARTVTTTPLPRPSTVTTTPCVVASTATATPPVPCASTSTMPCPVVASTLTTTPCGPAELAQLGALAVAGSHETPQMGHSASSLPHSKLTLSRGGRETTKVSTTEIETTTTTTTTVEKTSTTSSAITTSTTTTHNSSTSLTTIASLTGIVALDSNMANSIGSLAVSGASMPAKTVLSRRHAVHHAQKKLRSKEHEGTHTFGSDKSLMLVLAVASLSLLLFVVVPYWYNCHRSSDIAPLSSARVNEEAPLLADDVVEPPMWTKIAPESPRELTSPVSPRHHAEELPDTPEVLADTVPLMSDPMQSQAEHATDVTAEPEPELPIAVEASGDKPSSPIAPKEISPSPDRRREIPPVGEALKNSGCCACRGRH